MKETQQCINGDGRDAVFPRTGECRVCYNQRYYRTKVVPDWLPVEERLLASIGYSAAHKRVASLRGPASAQTCTRCGNAAEQWSYTQGDAHEQTGYRTYHRDGKSWQVFSRWSPNIWAYESLCLVHHLEKDGGS